MGEATVSGTSAALIAAGASTAAAGGSIGATAISTHKSRKFSREMYEKQRADSLQDTADARIYAEQVYNKYESPEAKKQQYMKAGYSPLAAIGQSASFQPPAITPNSDTSAVVGADASLTESQNQQISSALSQLNPLQYFESMNLMEDARSKKMENDQKEKENNAKDSILDISTSPDDFPQLYHYDQGWFERAAKRLGHQPTFRDMMTMAIAKTYVHQANAIAGHHHDTGLSGYMFEAWTDGYHSDTTWSNGRRPFSQDGEHGTDLFWMDIANALQDDIRYNSNRGRLMEYQALGQDLSNAWQEFYNENQAEIERAYKDMRKIDADWYVAEKWLDAISTGSEALSNIVDMIPTAKAAKIVSRNIGGGAQLPKGKPRVAKKLGLPEPLAPRPAKPAKSPKPQSKQPQKNKQVFDFTPYE